MTTYDDVVRAFESIIKSKYILADGLVEQWFKNALGEYELNVGCLGYDKHIREFSSLKGDTTLFDEDGDLKNAVVLNLAALMKSFYMEQEKRRVNQLNNIIGKDISLNGTGDTKKYTTQEANNVDSKVADYFQKQKPAALV